MKLRILIVLCSMSFTLMVSAQASGGQITRKENTIKQSNRKENSSTQIRKKESERVSDNRKREFEKRNSKRTAQTPSEIEEEVRQLRKLQEQNRIEEECRKIEEEKRKEDEKMRPITSIIESMVFVEGGKFIMGANSEDEKIALPSGLTLRYSKPCHEVLLSNYYIGNYDIMNFHQEIFYVKYFDL